MSVNPASAMPSLACKIHPYNRYVELTRKIMIPSEGLSSDLSKALYPSLFFFSL